VLIADTPAALSSRSASSPKARRETGASLPTGSYDHLKRSLIFDTQREAWLDLDALPPSPSPPTGAELPIHPKRCGPCEECKAALGDYATAYIERLGRMRLPPLPHTCEDCGAHFKKEEAEALREHLHLCKSCGTAVPVKDEHGNTIGELVDPDPIKLARHVELYGTEGAEAWLHRLDDPGVEAVTFVISRRSGRSSPGRMVKRPKRQRFVGRA
jgi:hypothetical protein